MIHQGSEAVGAGFKPAPTDARIDHFTEQMNIDRANHG
jgi:hypothetical protein